MRKIGSTSTGSVIIEMTAAQYAALTQVMGPKPGTEEPGTDGLEKKEEVTRPVMAVRRKQGYVRNCLSQLRPDTRKEVFRSIRAMFHGSGGIRDTEIDQMIDSLIKDQYFSIDANGDVRYADEKAKVPSILEEENRGKIKGHPDAQQAGIGPEDQDSLEDAFCPALLTEVPEGDDTVNGQQQIKQFEQISRD